MVGFCFSLQLWPLQCVGLFLCPVCSFTAKTVLLNQFIFMWYNFKHFIFISYLFIYSFNFFLFLLNTRVLRYIYDHTQQCFQVNSGLQNMEFNFTDLTWILWKFISLILFLSLSLSLAFVILVAVNPGVLF